jgi:hypothetical protein
MQEVESSYATCYLKKTLIDRDVMTVTVTAVCALREL